GGAHSCHVAQNEPPSGPTAPGIAFAPARELLSGRSPCSSIAVSNQTGSEIRPRWPLTVAVACENATVPKFVSGSVVQSPALLQPLGASATHSAAPTAGRFSRSPLVK